MLHKQEKPRLVVKVGSNVLLQDTGALDYNTILSIVTQLMTLTKKYSLIFVSSGAVSVGKETGDLQNIEDPLVKRQIFASIGQSRLMDIYSRFFGEQRIAQLLLTKDDFSNKETFYNTLNTLEGILANNIIPIINENDATSLIASSFGDNDQLASLTAIMLQAEKLIILSTITGFYTADPLQDKTAKLIPIVEKITPALRDMCEDSLSSGGSGGMLSKLHAAQMAIENGIEVVVTSGKEKNSLLKAANGETTGTYFKTKERKERQHNIQWMYMPPIIKGILTIDKGALKALQNSKSLLLVGVKKVQGDFKKKDVILIQTESKIKIATALANYSKVELLSFIHNQNKQGVLVVHTNHLYLFE